MLQDEFPGSFIWVSCHYRDIYATPGTDTRARYYGVGGLPHVRIDGKYKVSGASSCYGAYLEYRAKYIERMNETGGMSPVEISEAYLVTGDGRGYVQATFELLDPASLNNATATFFVYEDHVGELNRIARVIRDEPVTLLDVGDEVTAVKEFELGPWNLDELRGFVILQERDYFRPVAQAGRLTRIEDYALSLPRRLASVPGGSGEALFNAALTNLSDSADSFALSTEGFDWPAGFQVSGDANWYTSHDVLLMPGEETEITVRVQTNDEKRIGTGSFSALSQDSGREQPMSLRVFNGSYAVLLVDDDGGDDFDEEPMETPFESALGNLGYLYDNWDVEFERGRAHPRADEMAGYDVVIWQRGLEWAQMASYNKDDLMVYLDSGGSLLFSAMDFLNNEVETDTFTREYLGVDSWTNSSGADVLLGVDGDPISDGMILLLNWPNPQMNHVDEIFLRGGAVPLFYSESYETTALRKLTGAGGCVVFSTVLQNAISQTDPAPNNSETVIARSLEWLLEFQVTSVESPLWTSSPRLEARPNPFSSSTKLVFEDPDGGLLGPVVLRIYDISGRAVRTLADGARQAGRRSFAWDGLDERGHSLSSGVYFARLSNPSGVHWVRLVLLR